MTAGIIGDKFEKKHPMIRGWITVISCLMTPIFFFGVTAGHGNFWISIMASALAVLFAGCYHTTAVTMIQNSISSKKTTKTMGTWTLCTTFASTFSPLIFSYSGTKLNIAANASIYGPLIMTFVLLGYLPAAFVFFLAGKRYRLEYTKRAKKSKVIAAELFALYD